MSLVVVTRQALFKKEIRCQRVEVVLKVVVVFQHGSPHTFDPIVGRLTSQPVGFPVHEKIAIVEPEEQIN